jgi:Flp pilus assembly protein TadB
MIQRLLTALLGMVFLLTVFVFTAFVVALALTAGVLGYAWLWWRSRRQRRRVIEGEYRVIESR